LAGLNVLSFHVACELRVLLQSDPIPGPTGRHSSAKPSGLGNRALKSGGLKGRDKGDNHLAENIIHGISDMQS